MTISDKCRRIIEEWKWHKRQDAYVFISHPKWEAHVEIAEALLEYIEEEKRLCQILNEAYDTDPYIFGNKKNW